MVKDFFIFGDVNTLNYDCIITEKNIDTLPARDVEYIHVPGRNGDLVIDNGGYSNVDISYTLYFNKQPDRRRFIADVGRQLGYVRLEDSEYPDEYRMACVNSGVSVSRFGYDHSKSTVTMKLNAKPQRWLKIGEQAQEFVTKRYANYSYLHNFTENVSIPSIIVTGVSESAVQSGGEYLIVINDAYIHISDVTKLPIYIDCETKNCTYSNGASANNAVRFVNDVRINPGQNTIHGQYSAGLYFSIIPGYWRV